MGCHESAAPTHMVQIRPVPSANGGQANYEGLEWRLEAP